MERSISWRPTAPHTLYWAEALAKQSEDSGLKRAFAPLAESLARALEGQRLLPTPLTPGRERADVPLDPRWRVLVNDDVEPDV